MTDSPVPTNVVCDACLKFSLELSLLSVESISILAGLKEYGFFFYDTVAACEGVFYGSYISIKTVALPS